MMIFVLLCFGLVSAVTSLNEVTLLEACRSEDGYHRCRENNVCVKRWQVDAKVCKKPFPNCGNDEIRCRVTNRCIPRPFVGTKEGCRTDDNDMRLPCRFDEYKCQESGLCVHRHAVGDGEFDCISGVISDTTDEEAPYEKCEEVEFRCNGDTVERCIPREWVMDGSLDCKDGTDEKFPLETCRKDEFQCENRRCVPRYRIADGFPDCVDGSDEAGPFDQCTNKAEFRCNNSGRCIPRSWVMDGIKNCPDNSDENVATNFVCVDGEFRCKNRHRCLPFKYTCDGINHCGDCSDEVEACEEPRMWRCPGNSSICILHAYGCDDFPDCPDANDNPEYFPGFKCQKDVVSRCVIPQWTFHDSHSYCKDQSDLCFKNKECTSCISRATKISKLQICDGVLDCGDLTDECLCSSNAAEIEQFCQAICYAGIPSTACEFCMSGELLCPDDNTCVSLDNICNGIHDCQTSSMDEKFCTRSPGLQFKSKSGNSTLDTADLPRACSSTLYENDPFSSQTELIKSVPGLVILWITGIMSTIGNILLLYKDFNCWNDYSKQKRTGRVFRINIVIASAGMGISTLALVIKSSTFSGQYCSGDRAWRVSGQCAALGVFFLIFNQATMFSLLSMACFRLNAFLRPFKHHLLKLNTRVIPAVFTWIVSGLLSTLPLALPSTMALISATLHFNQTTMHLEDFEKFARRILILAPTSPPQNDFQSWASIESNLDRSYRDYSPVIQGYFGYYSSHGICIPRMIVNQSQKAHTFTLTIIILNFLIVTFNAVAAWSTLYHLITKKIGNSNLSIINDPAGRRQIMVSTVGVIHLSCWLPISFMAVLNKSDVAVSDTAYAVGVLLLPLPSALSPIVYSFGNRKKYIGILERICRCKPNGPKNRTESTNIHETNL